MRYCLQFIDRGAQLVEERLSAARTAEDAVADAQSIEWPFGALLLRIVDLDGREVYESATWDCRHLLSPFDPK